MSKGTWVEFSADLTSYSDVYVRLYYDGSNAFRAVDDILLTTATLIPVSITPAGLATFSSTEALDFTSVTAIEAYTATVTSAGVMTFTRINKVPANTGLLLRNAQGEDQGAVAETNVPVLSGTAETVSENALVAVSTEITSLATDGDGCTNYILNKVGDNVGFYRAAGKKVGAGKAYLRVPADAQGNAREFYAISFDNATGISEALDGREFSESSHPAVYNLNGQRKAQPTRGLNIINGKKVVVK